MSNFIKLISFNRPKAKEQQSDAATGNGHVRTVEGEIGPITAFVFFDVVDIVDRKRPVDNYRRWRCGQ